MSHDDGSVGGPLLRDLDDLEQDTWPVLTALRPLARPDGGWITEGGGESHPEEELLDLLTDAANPTSADGSLLPDQIFGPVEPSAAALVAPRSPADAAGATTPSEVGTLFDGVPVDVQSGF